MNCETCPFNKETKNLEEMKKTLKKNYDTNYMDGHTTFPKWKPGLCHKGNKVCEGYKK